MMQEDKLCILVGYKFRPSDEELVGYYLYRKVSGFPIPCVDFIVKECDLYGDEPGNIWESYGGPQLTEDEDLYFFAKLKKKTPKSSRINRKVGSGPGTWQGEDAPTDIVSSKSQQLIGYKKRFRYENDKSEDNGCWIMHEYTLAPSLLGQNESTNYVLCRIRKNQPTGRNKKTSLAKKRKLQDFQNNIQSVDSERFSTQQESKQVVGVNNVESQSYEVPMVQQEASWNTDMMIEQSFPRREAGGTDFSDVAGAGQHEVPMRMTVPDPTTQTLTMVQSAKHGRKFTQQERQQQQMCFDDIESRYEAALATMKRKISSDNNNFWRSKTGGIYSSSFAEQHEAPVPVVPDHQRVTFQQKEASDDDWLSGMREEDFCLLRKMFPADEFDNQLIGESGPIASVDWMNMPCMQEMLFELPELVSEEYVSVPRDDEENAEITTSSFDTMMKNHESGCKGIIQRSESVAEVPVAFPDQTVVSKIREHQPVSEENVIVQSASVDRGIMQSMSELPQVPSEVNAIAPIGGEYARSTSNSSIADWGAIIDEVKREDPQIVLENYGRWDELQKSESVAEEPTALPDQKMMSKIPEHQPVSEENAIAPIGGDYAKSTSNSSSVDWDAIIDKVMREDPQIVSENYGRL